jgi:hypothetical protein
VDEKPLKDQRRQQQDVDSEEVELEVDLSGDVPHQVIADAVKAEGRYALLGLLLGGIMIIAGLVFMVLGYSASIDLTIEGSGTKGHIVTGSLGFVVAVVGASIVYFTRHRVKIRAPKAAKG